MEKTLVIIKPDGVKRGLIGNIIKRIEDKGYIISAMMMKQLSKEQLDQHYEEHKNKTFYPSLVSYMSSGNSLIMIVEGVNAIKGMRKIMGATDPIEAEPGSIRGMYGNNKTQNLIHGSDSLESAEREINLFFNSF
ncbi:nucleoside-diphosphate kinase [Irregularibacter muris]|uniref:Nucleoside diphosphate kinase n=1 Tax=Irregularibacter muris TaxID=1796619 RepID=A0AAE3L276_9FIRM|nr:nucleoside-diphosphate kinase [Irregularibacter muris]MCR1898064.1 nucleoside-diphosphate kinase [Irregularibacter muris]